MIESSIDSLFVWTWRSVFSTKACLALFQILYLRVASVSVLYCGHAGEMLYYALLCNETNLLEEINNNNTFNWCPPGTIRVFRGSFVKIDSFLADDLDGLRLRFEKSLGEIVTTPGVELIQGNSHHLSLTIISLHWQHCQRSKLDWTSTTSRSLLCNSVTANCRQYPWILYNQLGFQQSPVQSLSHNAFPPLTKCLPECHSTCFCGENKTDYSWQTSQS